MSALSGATTSIWSYLASNLASNSSFGLNQATARAIGTQFVKAIPFGAGYSFGTYAGFPKNYMNSNQNFNTNVQLYHSNMPFNRRTGRWYPYRGYRRYFRRYRRRY